MNTVKVGTKVKTPVGIMVVDDISENVNDGLHYYLSGNGFTWNGSETDFLMHGFKKAD